MTKNLKIAECFTSLSLLAAPPDWQLYAATAKASVDIIGLISALRDKNAANNDLLKNLDGREIARLKRLLKHIEEKQLSFINTLDDDTKRECELWIKSTSAKLTAAFSEINFDVIQFAEEIQKGRGAKERYINIVADQLHEKIPDLWGKKDEPKIIKKFVFDFLKGILESMVTFPEIKAKLDIITDEYFSERFNKLDEQFGEMREDHKTITSELRKHDNHYNHSETAEPTSNRYNSSFPQNAAGNKETSSSNTNDIVFYTVKELHNKLIGLVVTGLDVRDAGVNDLNPDEIAVNLSIAFDRNSVPSKFTYGFADIRLRFHHEPSKCFEMKEQFSGELKIDSGDVRVTRMGTPSRPGWKISSIHDRQQKRKPMEGCLETGNPPLGVLSNFKLGDKLIVRANVRWLDGVVVKVDGKSVEEIDKRTVIELATRRKVLEMSVDKKSYSTDEMPDESTLAQQMLIIEEK